MNRYDKEMHIINDFQDYSFRDTIFIPNSIKNMMIFRAINNRNKWKKWIDTSSKRELPPDFYNPSLKLMMDVMRIDDHEYVDDKGNVINPTNMRESELVKELINKNKSFLDVVDKGNLIIVPDSGLRGEEDHNYNNYVNSFNRVVSKHIKKIDNYKNNHPNYKTIFFILDESSPYAKFFDDYRPSVPGECFFAEPHLWWFDKNMVELFKESKIDYVIWWAPYKHFDSKEKVELPPIVVIDVKRYNYSRMIDYKQSDMYSMET